MIRAIAIDDEPLALTVIESFCQQTDKIQLVKTFLKPNDAQKYIENFPVDLIFLDIQMPSVSGIDFFKNLNRDVMVIFTTAYSEYAIEGFNLNAIDYLLKPFTLDRFQQAVHKAVEYFNFATNSGNARQPFIEAVDERDIRCVNAQVAGDRRRRRPPARGRRSSRRT